MLSVVDGQLAAGPTGADKLHLLSINPESASMYFEELTGSGNALLWSFHVFKNRRILFSHQISVNNSFVSEQIVAMTQAGYCDATGGNGHPIRK